MSRKTPLSALQIFTVAARHGSFQAAANELHVTPGAVSRQIKALEGNLGQPLFVRRPRQVELTATGRTLFDLVLPAVNMIDEAWQQISGARQSSALHLECTPTFAMHWLIPRLASFRQQHPQVEVVLRTAQGPVDRNTPAHLVIRRCPSQFSGLAGDPFMDEHALPVCSPDYRQQQDIASPASLRRVPLIGVRSRPDLWPKWFAQQQMLPGDGVERLEFDNTILALQAAAQGLGVAFIPCLFLDAFLASGNLVPVPGCAPTRTGAYHWLSPRGKLPRCAEDFIAWLMAAGDAGMTSCPPSTASRKVSV